MFTPLWRGVKKKGCRSREGAGGQRTNFTTDNSAKLYQNSPNPFSSSTRIEYYIPTDAANASLYIFNLTGEMLQEHAIDKFGHGAVVINGSTLEAGMYIYSLVINDQIVDTKRMILTK